MATDNIEHVEIKALAWNVAADIYLPPGFDKAQKYATILSAHPIGSRKERTSRNVYGSASARDGFVVITFDASFQGASGGEPRYIEDPTFRVQDFSDVIDYLVTLPYVAEGRIGVLGICGGGGYSVNATMTERRIKALGTVTGVNYGRLMRESFTNYDPISALEAMAAQRTAEARGARLRVDYVLPSSSEEAKKNGLTQTNLLGATEYCRTDRGFRALAGPKSLGSHGRARGSASLSQEGEAMTPTPPMSRRQFLGAAAGVAGAIGAPSLGGVLLGASAAAAPAGLTGTIKDVKHVVIFMLENRSFDHYFGTFKGVRGFDDTSTISLANHHDVFDQPTFGIETDQEQFRPWALDWTSPANDEKVMCNGQLDHGWATQHQAWNWGRMDDWVRAKKSLRTLGYLKRSDIPFHWSLAEAYTICDAYHSSLIGSTGPNRTYLWSGMIDPLGKEGGPAKNGGDFVGKDFRWKTVPEYLTTDSWRVYNVANGALLRSEFLNDGDNALEYFKIYGNKKEKWYKQGVANVDSANGLTPSVLPNIVKDFTADVVNNHLPLVSWIVVSINNNEHPPSPPSGGALAISEIVNALWANTEVANSTALFVNYDENDGLFDHVPPPTPEFGREAEWLDGEPIGMGFRVPMIVVSPWTRGGWVNSQTFDHTSVIRFLETWSAAKGVPFTCSNISSWRREVAGDLTSVFDFQNPDFSRPTLASVSKNPPGVLFCQFQGNQPHPPKSQDQPSQEPGTRQARAIPIQPNAYIKEWSQDGDTVRATFAMDKETDPRFNGTHVLALYANGLGMEGNPRTPGRIGSWNYTVSHPMTDTVDAGSASRRFPYDFTIVGPNRYFRRFQGPTADGEFRDLEAKSKISVPPDGSLKSAFTLTLVNNRDVESVFSIVDSKYDVGWPAGNDTPQLAANQWKVQAKGSLDVVVDLTGSQGWYDFAVREGVETLWKRSFIGHVENGLPSVTGLGKKAPESSAPVALPSTPVTG